jgi:arylsulfatase A-like enzyme
MNYFKKLIQSFLLFSLIIVLDVCQGTTSSKSEHKKFPNVLLISLDACRADSLSCYGYFRKTSPFIDQLASSGIRFDNAFVNTFGTTTSHTTMLSSLYQETHRVDYYYLDDPIPTRVVMIQEILKAHGFVTLSVTDGGRLFRHYGFDRGFWVYNDQGGGIFLGTKKLIKLIRKYTPFKKPIFVFYHTYEIHSPYFPPKKYKKIFGEYKSKFVPSSENLLKIKDTTKELSDNDLKSIKAMYDAGIRYTDDYLKKFFAELREIGFFDNCIFIITADHGEEFGDHGGVLHQGKLYDELIHVPLIIAGTNIPKGIVDKRMVNAVDIVPTIMDYLDIKIATPTAGHSLLAQLSRSDNEEGMVFSQCAQWLYSVRTPRWKCIEAIRPPGVELYDLKADPKEKNNIASQKPDIVNDLIGRIRNWKKRAHQVLSLSKRDVVLKNQRNKLTDPELKQLITLGYLANRKDSKEIDKSGITKRFSKRMLNINLPPATNNITVGIDQLIVVEKDFVKIQGWAFIKGKNSLKSRIYVLLKSKNETIVFDTFLRARSDVAVHFSNENLEDSGFITIIQKELLKKGEYQVGIYIEKQNLKALQFFSRYFRIK